MDIDEEATYRGAPMLALLPACLQLPQLYAAHTITLLLHRLVDKVTPPAGSQGDILRRHIGLLTLLALNFQLAEPTYPFRLKRPNNLY